MPSPLLSWILNMILFAAGVAVGYNWRNKMSRKRNPLIAGMKIYVAGPYTKGDVAVNVRNAIEAGNALFEEGAIPFIPHLTHFWHMLCPQDYHKWLMYDSQWLGCCDMLLRLEGESEGADEEVSTALALNIPVYYGIADLLQ